MESQPSSSLFEVWWHWAPVCDDDMLIACAWKHLEHLVPIHSPHNNTLCILKYPLWTAWMARVAKHGFKGRGGKLSYYICKLAHTALQSHQTQELRGRLESHNQHSSINYNGKFYRHSTYNSQHIIRYNDAPRGQLVVAPKGVLSLAPVKSNPLKRECPLMKTIHTTWKNL